MPFLGAMIIRGRRVAVALLLVNTSGFAEELLATKGKHCTSVPSRTNLSITLNDVK